MSSSRPSVTRPPRGVPVWVAFAALLPGVLNLWPHLDGARAARPPLHTYLGFRFITTDLWQYMALARHARDVGTFAAPDPYVTDPQSGRMVLLFLWLVGRVARVTHLSLVACWYALTVLAGWALFLCIWRLCVRVFDSPRTRATAFLLACFGGGLDWVPYALHAGIAPDLDVSSTVLGYFWNWSCFGATQNGMWTAAYALAIGAWLLVLRWLDAAPAAPSFAWAAPRSIALGAMLFVTFFVHPYDAMVALGTLGLFACVRWLRAKEAWHASAMVLAGLALAVAGIASELSWARRDPVYARATGDLATLGDRYAAYWYPLMYGLPLLLACVGAAAFVARARRREPITPGAWLAACALIVTLVAANAPRIAAVKFQYLVHLPLCLAAAMGVEALAGRWRAFETWITRPTTRALSWVVLAIGPAFALVRDMPQTANDPTLYATAWQLDLLSQLDAQPAGGVLTSFYGGNLVPWRAGRSVYAGHWFLTYDLPRRVRNVERFFAQDEDLAWKQQFLVREHLCYVLEDGWIRQRGGRTDARLGLVHIAGNPFGDLYRVPGCAP